MTNIKLIDKKLVTPSLMNCNNYYNLTYSYLKKNIKNHNLRR